jgi:HTH-type transcriptional regulator / antitoxin HigA
MTITERHPFRSDYTVPPGETLAEVLAERGMTQAELVQRMGRPQKTISEIINGKAEITADTALQLERALGIPARFWGALERNYREDLARLDARESLSRDIAWLKQFPMAALRKLGIVPLAVDDISSMEALLRFFGVASVAAWQSEWADLPVTLRGSKSFASIPGALACWLRLGEVAAAEMHTGNYDAGLLEGALPEIRKLTRRRRGFVTDLTRLCAQCGIALVLTPEVPGSRVSGATYWSPRGRRTKAVIQLSHRYRTNDHFWFSFFHEAAHILRHKRRTRFVDLADQRGARPPDELDADNFAARVLIPSLDPLSRSGSAPFTPMRIARFARQIGIAPGIVVGRLEHDGLIRQGALRSLKEPFEIGAVDPT